MLFLLIGIPYPYFMSVQWKPIISTLSSNSTHFGGDFSNNNTSYRRANSSWATSFLALIVYLLIYIVLITFITFCIIIYFCTALDFELLESRDSPILLP